jgi:4-diphosphocytidyl-2-C-methyl-D-erythritol kinase
LEAEPADDFSLGCDDPMVPADGSNLVLRAAAAFREATGWTGGALFRLTKRIPMGAGLGGGSSNAAAALRALNELAGRPLDHAGLEQLAAGLGADCALFLAGAPVVMRGKGDLVEVLPPAAADRLRGRRVIVFKPGFGVATAWAYGRMAAHSQHYVAAESVETRLTRWMNDVAATPTDIIGNNMEAVVFAKYPALPLLHERLRERFGLRPGMSGSGSASFALLDALQDESTIIGCIREAWGPGSFVVGANLA